MESEQQTRKIFTFVLLLNSLSKIAIRIDTVVLTTINAKLYNNVFLVISAASGVLNRYSKLESPAQSLCKIPFAKFKCLKAMMIPVIGT